MLKLDLPNLQKVEASALIPLLDLYLEEAKKRVAASSLKDYRVCLAPFRQWWEENHEIHGYILSQQIFEDFITWYIDVYKPPRSPRVTDYMANKTTILIRRFLRWLHTKGAIPENIQEMCAIYPYTPNMGKYFPTINDLGKMFRACKGTSRIRDAALLAFLVETGARRLEVANVRVSDLTFALPPMDFTICNENNGHVHLRVVRKLMTLKS